VSFARRVAGTYVGIARTYRGWAPTILLLGVVVFVPLGLLDAAAGQIDTESINPGDGFKIAAVLATVAAVTTTGLLGEVFFSGAVATTLTHPDHERPPSLTQVARELRWWRLIAVDLIYVAVVAAGLIAFVVPGIMLFVFLGLAGPVVELEQRGVRAALLRSYRLVRGNFWFCFWVLVPIEVVGDAIGEGLEHLFHNALGDTFWTSWLSESVANVLLSPIFAVAAVLVTVRLIQRHDGDGPRLRSRPASGTMAAA
jgi:hypothetical protein